MIDRDASGYVAAQIAHAMVTRDEHVDPDARARAEAKIAKWQAVIRGMVDGTLGVGSRAPVAGAPTWVTLEVVKGGFATGGFSAGGPLLPHELARLDRLGHPPDERARARLNASYLSEAGLGELGSLLDSGLYRVEVPEEAALLVVAWLLRRGHAASASDLIETLAPFFDRLRFYPQPRETPFQPTAHVCRQTVGRTIAALEALRVQQQVARMNETLTVWNPLADRATALVLETVEDGRPFRRVGAEWKLRARALLADYQKQRAAHASVRKVARPRESFAQLRRVLELACEGHVTPRDEARTRAILAGIAAKRGLPGSDRHSQLRSRQARDAALPTKKELRAIVVSRLAAHSPESGLTSVEEVLAPLSSEEAARVRLAEGAPLPRDFRPRVERCLIAPIEALVERGVVPSPEVLAQIIPQLTAHVRASAVRDPELRRLYGALYTAFRSRRSLLLLDLSHQVRLEELPWAAAIEPLRGESLASKDEARATLELACTLMFGFFPHVIVPNPLLTEIEALAKAAQIELDLVEEIAADIFRGVFTEKYTRAAKTAARMLEGTVYERYYDARFAEIRALVPAKPSALRTMAMVVGVAREGLAEICQRRAGGGAFRSVAANGKIIEQQQILTTHNLAVLFSALDLKLPLPELARRTFAWILEQHQIEMPPRARLTMVKNTAYAWRQMVFYLAIGDAAQVAPFIAWAEGAIEALPVDLRARFRVALAGLRVAASGETLVEGPRFLGWTTEAHWMLAGT